jgi:predicted TIM-barrel fold metal-dependent hydrolase
VTQTSLGTRAGTERGYQVIDADAHVVESEHTWDFMDASDQKHRPVVITSKEDPSIRYWYADGKTRRPAVQVATADHSRRVATDAASAGMEDLSVRLRDMDELGIDVQVVHSTIFIETVADRPEAEVAICRGWNRWLADIWRRGNGRIRWSCVLPLLSMPDALQELELAKANGACAVFLRSVEGNRLLQDPYFFPLYEAASRLDMAMSVHVGTANEWLCELLNQRMGMSRGFWRFRAVMVGAFHALVMSGVLDDFPKLRFGFLESGAQWLPFVIRDMVRRAEGQGKIISPNVLQDNRVWVTCQTDDDLPYVLKYSGEDHLLIGTDYGHADQSSELDALENLARKGEIDDRLVRKISSDNPRAFYGL